MSHEHVLVVDDDKAFRLAAQTLLEDEGYTATLAASGHEALGCLRSAPFDLVLSDVVMETMNGIELLREIRNQLPALPVLMVTGFGSIPAAVEAMRLGAADYLTKPCNNAELLLRIRRTLDAQRRDRELAALREELRQTYSFGNMISRSNRMKDVIQQIRQVADADVTVLVQGESGTGKELVAHALHYNSIRRTKPFVTVNCSAIPENLLESELFGHEKGAFTGAMKQRIGRFEEANGGTLFLDEIGDVTPVIQTKLLRVLQEKSFQRVGGNQSIVVDTRVIAATNRNLELSVREGEFREDLFYRLNVFPIRLPALRERLEDVPLLAEHFVHRHAALAGGRVKFIAQEVLSDMMNYPWRGNIRELENLMKRAMLKTPGDTITTMELPGTGGAERVALPEGTETMPAAATPYKEYMSAIVRDAEEKYILRMLRLHKGNINQIARLMDVDRKTLYRKMAEYQIEPGRFR